jgi:hypothetical protein
MTLAAAVFALDVATKRGEREGMTRSLELIIPVVNYARIQHHADDLYEILYVLSDDNWSLQFLQRDGSQESGTIWPESRGKTLLFSGGLDSLAGAVGELEFGSVLQLASHYTLSPAVRTSQRQLYDGLSALFGAQVTRVSARMAGRQSGDMWFPPDNEREPSQRTRSFMFLVLGAIAARRSGHHQVLMIAENGQMAIHLPLSPARIGAFSTHTAHPQFVRLMERFLSGVLGFPFILQNPFLYKTKAECIATLALRYPGMISDSISCWRSSRQSISHCGECVPCLIRRIALEYHGLKLKEYGRDLLSENIDNLGPEDTGKKNLIELAEFVTWFSSGHTNAKLMETFPDLVNEDVDMDQAIAMYTRFGGEAMQVLSSYPGVRSLLA